MCIRDRLTLAAANGNHRVDGLDACLQRLLDRLAVKDSGRRRLNGTIVGGFDGAFTVDGLAQRVDDTADQSFAHRDGDDLARALDGAAFLDELCIRDRYWAGPLPSTHWPAAS